MPGQFKYLVFDERGEITQVNHAYDRKGYPDVLHDNDVPHVEVPEEVNLFSIKPETMWVKVHGDAANIVDRPTIAAGVSKSRIKADGVDASIIKPLPKMARITVLRNGLVIPGCVDVPLNDTVMEVTATQPGRYRVQVEAFPHQSAVFEIEAVE